MHFDDRLATVLRHRAQGESAAKTQFRQLIDLLGERPQAGDPALKAAAYLRLIALAEIIPVAERARIVGESGWRFRNPELVKWFGEAHPTIAASALYRAHLTGAEWQTLIPRLPIRARGFLRHRRDLPAEAVRVLDQLGVQDRALPLPAMEEPLVERARDDLAADIPDAPAPLILSEANAIGKADNTEMAGQEVKAETESAAAVPPAETEPAQTPPAETPPAQTPPISSTAPVDRPPPRWAADNTSAHGGDIRALVDRIEAYKRNRTPPKGEAPTLPLAGMDSEPPLKLVSSFLFGTDSEGKIDWAEPETAPMVLGTLLVQRHGSTDEDDPFTAQFLKRRPMHGVPVKLRGAEAIAGDWVVDATPRFTRSEGRYYGYVGRFRRAIAEQVSNQQKSADRLRQLLHELRTPVNAMQGYAEVIQQQVFGPTPHEYRALAASIAGDSARILAGFDELDRLAKLETGAIELETGSSDFVSIARTQIRQLQSVLSPRVARFDADVAEGAAPLPLAQHEAEMLAWRVLATLAGATAAGETLKLDLRTEDGQVALRAQLPNALAKSDDVFSSDARTGGSTVSSGIFGAGFSLRLARAEARAARGELSRDGDWLILSLPLLTGAEALRSPVDAPGQAGG